MEPVTEFILGKLHWSHRAEACARRRECGRLSSSAHFSPREKDKLSHTKRWQLWQGFVAVRRTSHPVFPPAYPSLEMLKFSSLRKVIESHFIWGNYFIRWSHCERKHSKQDLWSHSSLFNLGNLIHCVHSTSAETQLKNKINGSAACL